MDQRGREWRIEELAERARRRSGAEGETAPVFRYELAKRTDHHRKRAAGKTEADQHAGRKVEFYKRRRLRHPGKPRRIEDRADAEHPHRTEAVGDCPCKWLRHAPEQILYGDCQGERLAAPAAVERQRREELAERRTRTERDQRDDAADRDQHDRCPPPCKLQWRGCGDSRHGGLRKFLESRQKVIDVKSRLMTCAYTPERISSRSPQ